MAVLTNNKLGGISKLDRCVVDHEKSQKIHRNFSWEGLITPDELMTRLTNILEKYGHILTEARISE